MLCIVLCYVQVELAYCPTLNVIKLGARLLSLFSTGTIAYVLW
jgi:hypothetical protein